MNQPDRSRRESRFMHIPFDTIPSSNIAPQIQHAEELATSNPEEAERQFRALADTFSDNSDCLFALGGFLDSSGRPDEAVPRYERALALTPDAPWARYAHLQLASSYRNLGRLDDAYRLLERAVRVFPELLALGVFRAFVAYDQGEYRRAVQTLVDVLLVAAPDAVKPYERATRMYKDDLQDRRFEGLNDTVQPSS